MANSVALKAAIVVMACMVLAAPFAEAAVQCGQVVTSLAPCLTYLQGKAPLPAGCCNGIKSLNSVAKTTPDRQAACSCIKKVASGATGIKANLASGLPGKCGVNIGYPISMSTDCSRVK